MRFFSNFIHTKREVDRGHDFSSLEKSRKILRDWNPRTSAQAKIEITMRGIREGKKSERTW